MAIAENQATQPSERADRLAKLHAWRDLGIDPYPALSQRDILVAELLSNFDEAKKSGKTFTVSGRLRSKRIHGNLSFVHIEDRSGQIQLVISKADLGDEEYERFDRLLDVGDFIDAAGKAFRTKKGELSLMLSSFRLLGKALRPLPDKWHGLKDEEERLRKRYLDILLDPDIKEMIRKRSIFWRSIREFLYERGFIEVETPVLEISTGGADARPFITHHNALDLDVYLRISMGELWQKRLMVAGLEKTFEIGRQFRNEGMDAEHLQDYTQMEFYWAYADYEAGMALVEELFKYAAMAAFGTFEFTIGEFKIDLNKRWERYDYRATVLKYTGIDILSADIKAIETKLDELGVRYDRNGWNITRAIDNLWKYCRKQIAGPGFLINVPVTVSPLAKQLPDEPRLTQRFQPIIAGSELGNGYSELNDPLDQARRFEEQQKLRAAGDTEAQMFDHEFVEALEYGMPPTCGFGLSERVFSFLMNRSARECQIFPLVKPRNMNAPNNDVEPDKASATATPADDLEQGSGIPVTMSDLGLDQGAAIALVDKFITDPITRAHLRETEVVMRALAAHFGEDQEAWGIIGLLHDIDWDQTKTDIHNHTIKAVAILNEAGANDILIDSIVSHAWGNKDCGEHPDKERTTRLQHALVAAETVTGLVVASALIQPDKKLGSLSIESLRKKYKQKAFAAKCDRNLIAEIEKTGMAVDDFLGLALKAIQGMAGEIGL